jgi:hypothetical protein
MAGLEAWPAGGWPKAAEGRPMAEGGGPTGDWGLGTAGP